MALEAAFIFLFVEYETSGQTGLKLNGKAQN
jgi:hypothetical protein